MVELVSVAGGPRGYSVEIYFLYLKSTAAIYARVFSDRLDPSPSPRNVTVITVAVAHLSCSSSAHKDCKCVCMMGYEHVMHQRAVRWNEGANEIASSVRATIRSQSKKSKHGNETSVDMGNSGSTGDMSTEGTADTHQAVNGSHEIEENRNGTLNVDLQHQDGDVDRKLDSKPSFRNSLRQRLNILLNPVQSLSESGSPNRPGVGLYLFRKVLHFRILVWEAVPIAKVYELSRYQWAAEEPLGHAAAIITDVLENAETNHVISAVQKQALDQEMALRLT
ncbi:unnamed protein product [Prunus brigantina]